MLRPQVFALQERDDVKIGMIASEKQAIDAAFIFTVSGSMKKDVVCTDKFGKVVTIERTDTS